MHGYILSIRIKEDQ